MTRRPRSGVDRRARRAVLRWCAWYTRSLPDEIATARRDEIASDLFEHTAWAEAERHSPGRTARTILGRAIAGVPADLAWRSAQVRGADAAVRTDLRIRGLGSVLAAITVAIAVVLLVTGVLVDGRLLGAIGDGIRPAVPAATIIVGGTVLAALAAVTLVRRRLRHIGALAGAAAALLIPLPAVDGLWYVSASTQVVTATVPWLHTAVLLLSASCAAVFLAGAIWWAPVASHRSPERSRPNPERGA